MSHDESRRKFLQAGLALPAAGLISSGKLDSAFQAVSAHPPVVYRTLGKTGLKVSGVGFGIGFVPVVDVVARAIDMGVNYYDTSRDYGDSEKIFAGVIKGRRDKIIISTKAPSKTKADIVKDLETSLKVLGTDYVDVLHLHGMDKPEWLSDEAIAGLEACKQSGKARFIGFSCHDPANMVDFVLKTKKFDVIQTTYSFAIGGSYYREQAVAKLHEAGIGVVAMKVVVALAGPPKAIDNPVKANVPDGPLAGIKWVLKNPAIGTTVPNMRTIEQLEMNFRAMSEPYTRADEKLLFVKNEEIRPLYCRMCYECRGKCPKDLPIPDMLRSLAYHDFAGDYHHAAMSFRDVAKDVRDVRCRDCSECAVKCPNGVHVQERLIRAQELLG